MSSTASHVLVRTALGLGLTLALVTTGAAFWHGGRVEAASPVSSVPMAPRPAILQIEKPPPVEIQTSITRLGASIDGKVGIAVRDVTGKWTARYAAGEPFPQQSVSKLWVAITLLDAVDRGEISLDETVTVRQADLTLFNQPIRRLIGKTGYTTTLGGLLTRALVESDNTANDVLLRRVGGSSAVKSMLLRKRLAGIDFGPGERQLQTAAAGLAWNPLYADAGHFRRARAALPMDARRQALETYLLAPPDGATAEGIVRALTSLERSSLLSPASTRLLIDTMAASRTGHRRLRAGLGKGWLLAHKTGTGQELGGMATGFNDVGLLTARSGRVYAVAVMISHSRAPIEARQALIAEVARAVALYEDPQSGPQVATSIASAREAAFTKGRRI